MEEPRFVSVIGNLPKTEFCLRGWDLIAFRKTFQELPRGKGCKHLE